MGAVPPYFALSRRAEGKSQNTLRLYLGAVDKLADRCAGTGGPDDPTDVTRAYLTAFTAAMTEQPVLSDDQPRTWWPVATARIS